MTDDREGVRPSRTADEARSLLAAAREARGRAYAPYSEFAVGAALLGATGRIFTAANVENASYGLTICAERAAVVSAIAAGAREFAAIAIAGPDDSGPCYPCGSCRQVLYEFAPELVIVVGTEAAPIQIPLSELLPHSFELPSPASDPAGPPR